VVVINNKKMMRNKKVLLKSFPNKASIKINLFSSGVIYSFNQKSTRKELAYIEKLNVKNKEKQIQLIDLKYDLTVSKFKAPCSISSSSYFTKATS
jgi:hypothetical protein